MGIYGQLKTKIFIWDKFWGILRRFDNFREAYIVQAQKGPQVVNVGSKASRIVLINFCWWIGDNGNEFFSFYSYAIPWQFHNFFKALKCKAILTKINFLYKFAATFKKLQFLYILQDFQHCITNHIESAHTIGSNVGTCQSLLIWTTKNCWRIPLEIL